MLIDVAIIIHMHVCLRSMSQDCENGYQKSDPESLKKLLSSVGEVDAIICTAGIANLSPWHSDNDEEWEFGIRNKMMGQINTIRFGEKYVKEGGVIILTTGILAQHPFPESAIVTTVNAAVEAAVKASVTEIDRIRINAVSPGWISETLVSLNMDPELGLPAEDVAKEYVSLIEGNQSGEIIVAAKATQN